MVEQSSHKSSSGGESSRALAGTAMRQWAVRLASWIFGIVSVAGVAWLLIALAGVFHDKVETGSGDVQRNVPEGAIVTQVRSVQRPRYETAVGTVQPIHETSIAAKILARVIEVDLTAGKSVTAGQVLVKLDDSDLQARLGQSQAAESSAEARLTRARSDHDRMAQLLQTATVSQAEFDAAVAELRFAEADLERLRQATTEIRAIIEYATIRAPFTGIIVDKRVDVGDTVSPGQVLATLYDPTRMQLVATVRESLAARLQVGQRVGARLESLDHECDATISEVVPQADPSSRSFSVKVVGPCPPGIYAGVFGRLLLPLEDETVVVIPEAAVQRVGQLTMVDVVDAEGKHVLRRSVRLGRKFDEASVAPGVPGGDIEVLAGVTPGESILVIPTGGAQ